MSEINRQKSEISILKQHIKDCESCIDRRERIILGLENKLDISEREIAALRQQLEQTRARADNCEREARQWRQEARTQSAIVAEIYQELTGRTGEPGDWNGARPLRPAILRKQAEAIDRSLSYRPLLITVTGRNCIEVSDLKRYAQTLRQQADELEQKK